MSKFINTTHKQTMDSLVEGIKSKLNNPYYLYNDKKATIVDYYNQNTTMSTLDEGSLMRYSNIGTDSPARFNKISDAYLFGLDKVTVNLDLGDWGTEAEPIEGEAIVLPNTFIPIPGDYFRIKQVSEPVLFKILNVSYDTLDSGANMYRINYKLSNANEAKVEQIERQVVKNFKMVVGNVGTNFNARIEENDYNLVAQFEGVVESLKRYYTDLFFDRKVQTFVVNVDGFPMYDPYLIEFMIRNNIFSEEGDNYMHISHQTCLPHTFGINYDTTFFRSVELRDKDGVSRNLCSEAFPIHDPNSLMSCRSVDYFQMEYGHRNPLNGVIQNFDPSLADAIIKKEYYPKNTPQEVYNIYIDYFNEVNFDSITVDTLEKLNLYPNMIIFYAIPLIIHMINRYVENLMQ